MVNILYRELNFNIVLFRKSVYALCTRPPKSLKINQLSFCLSIFIENGTPRFQLLFRDSTLFCIFLTCIIFGHYSCFSDEFKWFLKPLMMANYYACSYFWCGFHFLTVWQNNCFILKRLSSQYRKRNLRIVPHNKIKQKIINFFFKNLFQCICEFHGKIYS